jgi:hypothetical protein
MKKWAKYLARPVAVNNDRDGLVQQVLDEGSALYKLQFNILRLAVQVLEELRPACGAGTAGSIAA